GRGSAARAAARRPRPSAAPPRPGPAVRRGLAWGTTVATGILAWRATDGYTTPPPPYTVGTAPGDWQPTPPAFLGPPAAPLFRQFAAMTPFALTSPSQFAPPRPRRLTSPRYPQDLAEAQPRGRPPTPPRPPEQPQPAIFWQDDPPAAMWNRAADQLAQARDLPLAPNARLLAQLNIALADATIAV